MERYAPWPHGGNAVNEALRKARGGKRFLKALYRRLAAVNAEDAELAQARLNRVLKTTDDTGNVRVHAIWGPDPMGDWHGRNK